MNQEELEEAYAIVDDKMEYKLSIMKKKINPSHLQEEFDDLASEKLII
eukprot:CAMPEP_0170567834 /NCGR_PEP_ID=MMETSP0211-20121228/80737_1 /TAXON_ID=311385 /ORGANISM="Pseudokeronopsis sp., Strain OXSARD2" /LENGTH=47 /DNA_ID= /DNA_START= /DNA_END= /DNA_ORIENTATION=